MKNCTNCLTLKPLADYIKDFSKKGGRGTDCRDCRRLQWPFYFAAIDVI